MAKDGPAVAIAGSSTINTFNGIVFNGGVSVEVDADMIDGLLDVSANFYLSGPVIHSQARALCDRTHCRCHLALQTLASLAVVVGIQSMHVRSIRPPAEVETGLGIVLIVEVIAVEHIALIAGTRRWRSAGRRS